MLFMIIEHFRSGTTASIGERFGRVGRMLPEGVVCHASWIDPANARCYQVMESPHADLLDQWISHWNDLIDFEIIPVLTSREFWSNFYRDSGI